MTHRIYVRLILHLCEGLETIMLSARSGKTVTLMADSMCPAPINVQRGGALIAMMQSPWD